MSIDEERIMHRFSELAEICFEKGRYTFTGFLGLAETDLFYRAIPSFSYVPYTLFGGAEGCERRMVRFGDEDSLGYTPPPFPIACLSICPPAKKFAEPLTHRDCLGALMNLGIKRECLGDIFSQNDGFCVFCEEALAPYLCENLTRIRHTTIRISRCQPPETIMQSFEVAHIQVASDRADAILSRAYNLSRGESTDLFSARRVFINGRTCTDGSTPLHEGDILTTRGYGRLRYVGIEGLTRKGKQNTVIEKFI